MTLAVHIRIAHFATAVEQLLTPALRGQPVVVGVGGIACCSPAAAACGLRVGMPVAEARRRCPPVFVLPPQPAVYASFAAALAEACLAFLPNLASHDAEVWGVLAGPDWTASPPAEIGARMRVRVQAALGLAPSVGLGRNALFARLAAAEATRLATGWYWIAPEAEAAFLSRLPVTALPGVPAAAYPALQDMNVRTVGELRALPLPILRQLFAGAAEVIYERCRGREPCGAPPVATPRRITREHLFTTAVCAPDALLATLATLTELALPDVRAQGLLAQGLELTVGYSDQRCGTGRRRLERATDDEAVLLPVARRLLHRVHRRRAGVVRLALTFDRLTASAEGDDLFAPRAGAQRQRLNQSLDSIRRRFGASAIRSALTLPSPTQASP